MGEIVSAFGIDPKLIIIQMFNFGILLVALWYFLYTPVLNILEERRKKVEKGVKDAEAAATSRERAAEEREELIAKAHRESEDIVKKAERTAQEKRDSLITEAEERAAHIITQSKKEGEERKRSIEQEAEQEIAKTAVLAAEKILREKTTS